MKNKINLGIIGKSFGYQVIYKSFLRNKKFKITGFSLRKNKDIKIKIPKKIKIYTDWKKLISNKKINAIAIAVPPKLHGNIIKYAVKKNKHIFCEKPLTCSEKEANIMCSLIKKKKNIAHIVNYEFSEIDAFYFFKKKILNKINTKKIYLNWFINIKKRSKANWKENHSKGGGIMFNFVCHAIYYLESMFDKIVAVRTRTYKEKSVIKSLEVVIFFKNGISANLNIKVGEIKNKFKPIHQLKIISDKTTYLLETKLNSLSDKFSLFTLNNKFKKTLFKEKENKDDFRIKPTFKNSKKFEKWIVNGAAQTPNFFDSQRIHSIINKIIISSKKREIIDVFN